jgi:hypothetical protein
MAGQKLVRPFSLEKGKVFYFSTNQLQNSLIDIEWPLR